MKIEELRRLRLRQWIDSDPHSNGDVVRWCDYYSQFLDATEKPLNPSYIRQLAPENGKPNRNIGEKAARKFERAGGKPAGWLDQADTPPITSARESDVAPSNYLQSSKTAAHSHVLQLPAWPFARIDVARLRALPREEQDFIEGQLLAAIVEAETRTEKRSASGSR